MKLSLRFVCPKCGEKFPFFLGSSNRVRAGFLSAPWLKCLSCGTMSRQTAAWPHALWAWPLAFFAVISVIALFRTTEGLVVLHRNHPGAYGALAGLSAGLCFFIIRFGLKLTPVFGESETPSKRGSRAWLKALFIAIVIVAVGLFTHRWLATLISVGICLAISGAFYLSAKKE